MNIDRFLIAGRITMPLQLRQSAEGRDVTWLPIAVNKRLRNKDGEVEDVVLYLDITCFDKTAKTACERLDVGCEVVVEGYHQNREIRTPEKTYTVISMVATNVHWPKQARKESA